MPESRWVKRTPDDLTQLLVGFDELLAALGPVNLTHHNGRIDPCACWREQLLEGGSMPSSQGNDRLCEQSDAEQCFGKYLKEIDEVKTGKYSELNSTL